MNQSTLFPTTQCQVIAERGQFVFISPYKPALVADLKWHIPNSDRKWDPTRKAWIIDPRHGQTLVTLVFRHCGELLALPALTKLANSKEMRILEVHYIGQCKDRGNGDFSAFGYANNDWSVV